MPSIPLYQRLSLQICRFAALSSIALGRAELQTLVGCSELLGRQEGFAAQRRGARDGCETSDLEHSSDLRVVADDEHLPVAWSELALRREQYADAARVHEADVSEIHQDVPRACVDRGIERRLEIWDGAEINVAVRHDYVRRGV